MHGRDRELARLHELVDSMGDGARFVVVRGEAGIGKTELWRHAIQLHLEAGHRVLATRASEDELPGVMVALFDLFDGVGCERDVLDVDVGLHDRGLRLLATLRRLADESPTVLAIDDLQWLDPVSAGALRYAFRRLAAESVIVIATERVEPGAAPDDRTLPRDRREEIFLGPLDIDALRKVIASSGSGLPRPVLQRIHALSGGNPMYAIELARAVDLFGDSLIASVPPTLRAILSSRLVGLPADAAGVLRVAAALGPSTVESISRAGGVVDACVQLGYAIDHGLLVVGDDHAVRFAHPLLASVVLADIPPLERRALHRRLAEQAGEPDSRARHLALSWGDPDAVVAAELDAAARRAARRGASSVAADLATHSARVTPSDDAALRLRRMANAILHRAAAGEKQRALGDCDELLATLPPGPGRAEVITLRVVIDFAGGDRFLEQALAEAGSDELLLGRILELRGWMAITYGGQLARGLELAEQALTIGRRHEDPTLEMLAASGVATAEVLLGRPSRGLMEHALRLAAEHHGPRLGRWPHGIHGRICVWTGHLAEARSVLGELAETMARAGMEFQRPYRIADIAELEIASGNLRFAAELVDDGIEAATDAGNDQAAAWLGYPAGLVHAHLGNVDRADAAVELLRAGAGAEESRTRLLMAEHVRGMVLLAAQQPVLALAVMAPALATVREVGLRLPSVIALLPDSIEAAALAGDEDLCVALAAELDEQAATVCHPWVDAAATRGRGLAALCAGGEGAGELLGAAAQMFGELGYALDAARSRLLQGRALRRAGRRNASADVIAEAHQRFAIMGAVPWAAHAEDELARVAPGRDRAELTPTESRVAKLVAQGCRNREIAGQLFVSVATVEAHLTRIYRKLQVRSRTELARLIT